MFSKTEITAYQNITAPAALREKILAAAQKEETTHTVSRRKNIRTFSALAACLLLTISLASYAALGFGAPGIKVDNKRLSASGMPLPSENSVAVASARSFSTTVIPLKIDTSGVSDIIVTDGEVHLFDPDSGELLASGQNITAMGEILLTWELSLTDPTASPLLTFTEKGKTYTITLAFDADEGIWNIFRS